MTTPQTGLTQEEISTLEQKIDQSKELKREINEIVQKLTPAQYQELQKKQLEKMPPEQRALAEQIQKQMQQQMQAGAAQAPQESPLVALQNQAIEAFKSAAAAAKQEPNLTFEQKLALSNAAAETAKGVAAIENALVENDKVALESKKLALALQQVRPGQAAAAPRTPIKFGFGKD